MKTILIVLCLTTISFSKFLEDNEFSGKVVLVTGGSTGIGYQIALSFAKQGANVAIMARNSRPECYTGEEAEKNINEDPIVKLSGGKALFLKGDISNLSEVKSTFNNIIANFGDLDIAVNNAGIGGYIGNLDQIPEDVPLSEHDPIFNNLYGVYNLMSEEIKYFKSKNKNGVIINLTSVNGIRSCMGCSMYAASKYGIVGLTKSVALENLKSPYIRVNAIAPGLVDTFLTRNQATQLEYGQQMWEGKCITRDDDLWKKYKPTFEKSLISGKIIDPQEIAEVALYLASDKSSATTGSVITADLGADAYIA